MGLSQDIWVVFDTFKDIKGYFNPFNDDSMPQNRDSSIKFLFRKMFQFFRNFATTAPKFVIPVNFFAKNL